jgi:mono/diheme cytochrome c family protein
MRMSAWILPLLVGSVPLAAMAQQSGDAARNGEQIFRQHCSVCHLKPSIVNNSFGPTLSKDTVEGKETAIKEFVAKGTPRMPGFQYTLQPNQVDLVLAYLKTVPAPAATDKPAAAPRGNQREDD